MPRDNQRQRLYDSEERTGPPSKAAVRFLTKGARVTSTGSLSIEACQNYVDHITTAAWFQTRWGQRHITVRHKTSGSATGGYSSICLPPWSRTEDTILHEMAHCLTSDAYATHGPEFAGVLLTLIRYAKGAEAARLQREAFREYRVRYSMKAVPAAGTKRVVPRDEQQKRQAARARQDREREKVQIARREAHLRSRERVREAARTMRALIKDGAFGEPGTKTRTAALATARTLEGRL